MRTAYVLIITDSEHEHVVYNTLCHLVDEIFPLFGEWDLIAKIHGNDVDELAQKVTEDIRSIEGVLSTKTLIGY